SDTPDDRFRPSSDALPTAITSRIDEVEVLDFGPPNEDTRAGRHHITVGIELELSRFGIDGVRLGEEQILFVRIPGGVRAEPFVPHAHERPTEPYPALEPDPNPAVRLQTEHVVPGS